MFENKYEAAAYVSPDKSLTSILQQMLAKLSKSIKITEETQRTNPLFAKTRVILSEEKSIDYLSFRLGHLCLKTSSSTMLFVHLLRLTAPNAIVSELSLWRRK